MVRRSTLVAGAEGKAGETRVALSPAALARLRDSCGVEVAVQEYPARVWPDTAYTVFDIPVVPTTKGYGVVAATKEFTGYAPKEFHPGQALLHFAHIHKEQPHNVPHFREQCRQGVTILDYELFHPAGMQAVNTSRAAGMAGAINGLALHGQRFGAHSVFSHLPLPGFRYDTYEALRDALQSQGAYQADVKILIVGETSACGKGATQVLEWSGIPRLTPDEVLTERGKHGPWFAVLGTKHIVEHRRGGAFSWDEYMIDGASAYRSTFENFWGRHDVLIYCPKWQSHQPKLIPAELLTKRWRERPAVISDVTCDYPDGPLACTVTETSAAAPVAYYDLVAGLLPGSGLPKSKLEVADLLAFTAVGNLPGQLGVSCSQEMSDGLEPWLPAFLQADRRGKMEDVLPPAYWKGIITWNGIPTQPYAHLHKLLH